MELQGACGGSVPFERFMREALHHPEFGYYGSRIRSVGRGGDFSTWPTLDSSVARAIARMVRASKLRDVIEIGAGTGALAAGIFRALGVFGRIRHRYHIVDTSSGLVEQQKTMLAGRGVRWHASMTDALAACGGRAFVFSNELVDAFPCRVHVRTPDGWSELHVKFEGGRAVEHLVAAPAPDTALPLETFPEGSRIEWHPAYREWMRSWLPAWRGGLLLTIDYGGRGESLYHRRPAGSVRAYAHQQRLTGDEVYKAFGRRDITADVNFDDLARWGAEDGLTTRSLQTLGDFLAGQGITPTGRFQDAGEAFFVLLQVWESDFPLLRVRV